MPEPAVLSAAANVGGWVFCAVVIAGLLILFFRALTTGDLVSGAIHRQALAQNDKYAEALGKLSGSVESYATQTAATLKELRTDVDELRGIPRRRD